MFEFTTFNRADLSKELCIFFVMITIITTVSYLSFFTGQEVYGQQSGQQLLGDDDNNQFGDGSDSIPNGNGGGPQGQGQGGEDSFPSDNPSGPVNPSIPSQPGNFLEYSDPELGFSIQYPAGSQVEEGPYGVVFHISGQESVVVKITQDVGMQLEEFTQNRINRLNEIYEGFELRTSEATTLGGNPAHIVVFAFGQGLAGADILDVVDNTGYEVLFITTQANVGNFVPIIDAISESFSIIQVGSNGDGSSGNSFGSPDGSAGGGPQGQGEGEGFGFPNGGGTGSFLTYENPTYGITMQYPSNWKETPAPQQEGDKPVVKLIPDSQEAYIEAYIQIFVYDLSPQVTTQEELNVQNIDFVQTNARILDSGPTTISGGNPAYFFELSFKNQAEHALAISTIMNNKEYWIQFGALPEIYDRYLPIAEQMISSLQIRSTSAGGVRESPGFDTPQQPPLSPSTPEPLPDTQQLPTSPVIDQEPVAPDIIMSPPPRTQSSPSSNTTSNVTK
jgi:hypothetical protein